MPKKVMASILVASALLTSRSYAQAAPVAVSTTTTLTPVPISAPLESRATLTSKEINEKTDLLEVKMRVPQVVGLSDQHFQEEFNTLRDLQAHQAIEADKQRMEQMASDAKKFGWPVRPGLIQMDYEVKSSGKLLSFTVTQYEYLGGANGLTTVSTYNIDTALNRVIGSLAELFQDGVDFRSVINTNISEQIKTRLAAAPHAYFEGKMGFQGITDTQGFYLKDNNLVLVFPKYSIAPGATGVPEFSIPLADLKDLLISSERPTSPLFVQGQELPIKSYTDADGVTMIPLRAVCEALGYQVNWDELQQMVEVVKGNQWTRVIIGQDNYSFAKMLIRLGTAPVIRGDRTFVPASFAEQVLKATVTLQDGSLAITQ